MSNDIITAVVAKVSDVPEGEMKEVDLGEGKVLLVKQDGKISAIGHKCTHYGAPLKSGALSNGRIRCPWHGACFSVETGDIEDFPGMDSIHTFKVSIQGEDVSVSAPASALSQTKRQKSMCSRSPSDDRLFVIVGAGPAGATCAEVLRQEGFTGRIMMIGKEKYLPYDRTKLSKAMSTTADKILMRSPDQYNSMQIETVLGTSVDELDADSKKIRLSDGREISYDKAFVATGGTPRTVPAPGNDLGNIFPLRVPEDSLKINGLYEGKRVAIVGSSFIGMEVACCIAKKARSVIVVGMETVPFERVLGAEMGLAFQRLHEKNNIGFRMKRTVKEFRGTDGLVRQVLLDNGEVLDADIVVVGAGVIPETKFIKGSNIKIERDQSIVADDFLCAQKDLYVGGDIARYQYHMTKDSVRIEHYGMAQIHGRTAAFNMVGKPLPIRNIPVFWTVQYGKSLRYTGHALHFDEFYVDGSLEEMKFLALYSEKGNIVAAAGIGRDQEMAAIEELFAANALPSLAEAKANKPNWIKLASVAKVTGK